MKERKLGLWCRADCDQCGEQHLATRTMERVVKSGEKLLCDDCETRERAYQEGYRSGLEAGQRERQKVPARHA